MHRIFVRVVFFSSLLVFLCVFVCVCWGRGGVACVGSFDGFNFKMRFANKFDDVNSRWLFSRRKRNFSAWSFNARFVVVSIQSDISAIEYVQIRIPFVANWASNVSSGVSSCSIIKFETIPNTYRRSYIFSYAIK